MAEDNQRVSCVNCGCATELSQIAREVYDVFRPHIYIIRGTEWLSIYSEYTDWQYFCPHCKEALLVDKDGGGCWTCKLIDHTTCKCGRTKETLRPEDVQSGCADYIPDGSNYWKHRRKTTCY